MKNSCANHCETKHYQNNLDLLLLCFQREGIRVVEKVSVNVTEQLRFVLQKALSTLVIKKYNKKLC